MGDLRFAWRGISKYGGFSSVAILSLALGIGATTALFSVIYGVLIAPYPYKEPGEIWAASLKGFKEEGQRPYSPAEYAEMVKLSSFSEVMATSTDRMLLTGDVEPESLRAVRLTGNAFHFLGVPPVLGRTIQPTDISPDGEAALVTVLSFKMWQRLFAGATNAIGKTLRLNDQPYTVIGVMPPRFNWWAVDGLWLPLAVKPGEDRYFNPLMRLKKGVRPEAAEAQLHAFHIAMSQINPAAFPKDGFRSKLTNYLHMTASSGEMERTLWLLFGAVIFLLLIACANVANLQLARASGRVREMAIRLAVGAGRARLLRQLLTESVLLSVMGGALGLLFAFGITRLIVLLMPSSYVPSEARIELNGWVLLFCLGVSMLTGILFGLAPAWQSSKVDLVNGLKDSGKVSGESLQGSLTRKLLVVGQVALSVVLLLSAGLMIRTFVNLQAVDLGYRPENTVTAVYMLLPQRFPTFEGRNRFTSEFLERIKTIPGVLAATIGNGGMPSGGYPSPVNLESAVDGRDRRIYLVLGGADYLRAIGIPLLRGRMLTEREVADGADLAVVNEAALKLWPEEKEIIGKSLKVGLLTKPGGASLAKPGASGYVTVVGVIGDTRNGGLRNASEPAVMVPFTLLAPPGRSMAVRTRGDTGALIAAIRTQLRQMDKDQPLGNPRTLSESIENEIVQPRFNMVLFGAFAVVGLTLAATGIYSVLSFLVARRTHEIGVRMALGAQWRDILGLVLSTGGKLVGVGLVLGLFGGFAATRLLSAQMFGVTPTDPISYAGVVGLFIAVGFLACYIPARRAAHVNPTEALRYE